MNDTKLPKQESLDTITLGRIFSKTKNSYKIFFFKALLKLSLKSHSAGNVIISLEEICREMAVIAWFPSQFFKLSFGPQDKIGEKLKAVNIQIKGTPVTNPRFLDSLNSKIKDLYQDLDFDDLMKYVPYRLARPFFENQLKGIPDQLVNSSISTLLETKFNDPEPPPYKVTSRCIELNKYWVEYFRKNYSILDGWCDNNLVLYLQSKNPTTPAISNKISVPTTRSSLKAQSDYWKRVISYRETYCLYSGARLQPDRFQLDHFLPWSFVCHDQNWNLIPVDPIVNAKKNNNLPSLSYLDNFVKTQQSALELTSSIIGHRDFSKITEEYVTALRIKPEEITNLGTLVSAYFETIPPLITLGKRMGYGCNWTYKTD